MVWRNNISVRLLVIVMLVMIACHDQTKQPSETGKAREPVPAELAAAITREFPGAMPYSVAMDTLLAQLARFGIRPEDILWGQSTCVDDITNTKNKLVHPEIKGPFAFGGLSGLPFTGVTGMSAFAHHVPETGTALLFVGPHIGYRTGDGWGKILRHGQAHSSTCCGALYAALSKLKQNKISKALPTEDDYQEQTIEQLALSHREEILKAKAPLVALTRIVAQEAERKMTSYAKQVHERHFAYAVLVVGVIINTDYQFDDYLMIDQVYIKDIKQDRWIGKEHF
jgi:hypothetical protein